MNVKRLLISWRDNVSYFLKFFERVSNGLLDPGSTANQRGQPRLSLKREMYLKQVMVVMLPTLPELRTHQVTLPLWDPHLEGPPITTMCMAMTKTMSDMAERHPAVWTWTMRKRRMNSIMGLKWKTIRRADVPMETFVRGADEDRKVLKEATKVENQKVKSQRGTKRRTGKTLAGVGSRNTKAGRTSDRQNTTSPLLCPQATVDRTGASTRSDQSMTPKIWSRWRGGYPRMIREHLKV